MFRFAVLGVDGGIGCESSVIMFGSGLEVVVIKDVGDRKSVV